MQKFFPRKDAKTQSFFLLYFFNLPLRLCGFACHSSFYLLAYALKCKDFFHAKAQRRKVFFFFISLIFLCGFACYSSFYLLAYALKCKDFSSFFNLPLRLCVPFFFLFTRKGAKTQSFFLLYFFNLPLRLCVLFFFLFTRLCAKMQRFFFFL